MFWVEMIDYMKSTKAAMEPRLVSLALSLLLPLLLHTTHAAKFK